MEFISYAQNFEDVMLWRALKMLPHGFYIDVGAWSPDVESVTRAFYERGWRGINIEPDPLWYLEYLKKRPGDINLQLALSDKSEIIELYAVGDRDGLSTAVRDYAEMHARNGIGFTIQNCKAETLNAVWEEYVKQSEVHFLKIDVEGFELLVLLGNDWTQHRPWIVVIEATVPNSSVATHHKWEFLLTDAKYQFAYFDGLNRFYIAEEHADLMLFFKTPPNVFDNFILNDVFVNKFAAEEAAKLLATERAAHIQTLERVKELEVQLAKARQF